MSHNAALNNEEEDPDFSFEMNSPEYKKIEELARVWCTEIMEIDSIPNASEGFALADEFQEYVEEVYPEVAAWVARDGGIYADVLMYWNMEQ